MNARIWRDALVGDERSSGYAESVSSADGPVDAERRYDDAEAAFLTALRINRDRSALTALAEVVVTASESWNTAVHSALFAASGTDSERLSYLTERTEVVASLWADIARALRGENALRDA